MKPELIQEALEGDWRPLWLPVAIDAPSEEVEIQPCRGLPLTGADASGSKLSLLEGLAAEKGAEALPAVQCDAMNITIQKYDATEKDGTADGRKYHTERLPEGPREPEDKINLEHKQYLSADPRWRIRNPFSLHRLLQKPTKPSQKRLEDLETEGTFFFRSKHRMAYSDFRRALTSSQNDGMLSGISINRFDMPMMNSLTIPMQHRQKTST